MAKKNWIAGAIKHPGAERRAAAKAGMSTHAYMEEHKNDSGTAGKRARLGLTLSGMNKGRSKGGGEPDADDVRKSKDYKGLMGKLRGR